MCLSKKRSTSHCSVDLLIHHIQTLSFLFFFFLLVSNLVSPIEVIKHFCKVFNLSGINLWWEVTQALLKTLCLTFFPLKYQLRNHVDGTVTGWGVSLSLVSELCNFSERVWSQCHIHVYRKKQVYLIGPVRHGEGELVGVLLFFTGVYVLDAARCQIGLGEGADSGAWREERSSRR